LAIAGLNLTNPRFPFSILFCILVETFTLRAPRYRQAVGRCASFYKTEPVENHKDNLLYLEGFLDSISYINTFDNDGKTYTVELVEKVNSNFQDTIRKLHNVKNWIITTELIKDNWRETLKRDLRPYFDQIIVEVFKKTNQISLFDEKGNINQQVNEL